MASSIPNRTSNTSIRMLTTMSLSIVFNKLQVIFFAESTNFVRIGITTIQMDNSNSLCFRCDCSLNEIVINLQRIDFGFYENRF